MSTGNKLINKVNRRAKNVRKNVDSDYKRYDKADKRSEVMAGSPGVYKLAKGMQRRFDSKFGNDTVAAKPLVALNMTATTIERYDFGGSDFGIRLTLPAAVQAFAGLRPNDVLEVLEGGLAGMYLKVISLPDSTHVRLEDVASYVGALGDHETTEIVCVADVTSSLNDTYFELASAADATEYYVWYNVDAAGTDPALSGQTGIEVAIAEDASAADVALATQTAIDAAASADFNVSVDDDTVTIENTASGETTDASDSGATGFSITVTVQGTDDDTTGSESDVRVRL